MSSHPPELDTSFESLHRAPEPGAIEHVSKGTKKRHEITDFASLDRQLAMPGRPYQHRSVTDLLIDALTPVMIFILVYSVIFFLLEVRFIYSEVHDKNLKMVAFYFILGVVALNRLIAQEGRDESIMYIFALSGAIALYTLATTSMYGVGSVARNFLDRPWIATGFNTVIVAIVWWTTNRLMHECCVDENRVAGDVGMLAGTMRKFQRSVQRDDRPKPKKKAKTRRSKDHLLEMMEIEAFDPLEWKPDTATQAVQIMQPTQRLPKRHPGMSVLIYSVPVMIVFALGLPVLRAGGDPWVKAGHLYVGVYTVTMLTLLMLTSLGGLREYFRSRRVFFPRTIGVFWIGLGTIMLAAVCVGALQMPMPPMPAPALIDSHETDYFSRGSTFRLQSRAVTAAEQLESGRAVERVGNVVLIAIGLFFAYGTLRAIGAAAAAIGKRRDRWPPVVVKFFDWLDVLLLRIVRVPTLPKRKRLPRVSRERSASINFTSPLRGEGLGSGIDVRSQVAVAYDALCALASDLGVPRHQDQTPYEFVEKFPSQLDKLKAEALELTDLYVRSAYSREHIDESTLDRLRKFWIAFEKARNRVVR